MTEEEAKTKWCPMVRAGLKGSNTYVGINWPAGDGKVLEQEYAKCIGSDCMMYRTGLKNVPVRGPYDAAVAVETGYCGLAGKP